MILLVAPERRTNEPGLSRYPAISLSAAGSASSWAEPMCSMLRDPHQEEECAICTARNAVVTVLECSVFLGPWFLVVSGCVFLASQLVFDLVGGAVAER